MERWVLAAVWAALPLTAGEAVADAIAGWSTSTRVVAAVLAWGVWAVTLLAVVVPRPVGLTVVRVAAPDAAVLAVVIAVFDDADALATVAAVVTTLVAAVLAARPPIAMVAANAAAYGDERRYPLRVPPALFLGPLPAVRLLVGAAVVAGPLLLADERWLLGALAVAVGVPVAIVGGRALHGLSSRWAVLVPAGFVVVDPLTLADPVLFPRERIIVLTPVTPTTPTDPETVDLRLGATLGSVALVLDRPAEVYRAVRTRRGSAAVRTADLRIAALRRTDLLADAASRRIPVSVPAADASRPRGRPGRTGRTGQTATPPPTSSSPS